MIDGGIYSEMARINAGAVNGMQPKISIWSNGGNDGAGEGSTLQQVAGVAGCTRCCRRCFPRCTSRPGCCRRRGWAP
jgi:hypothetical protein